MKLAKTLIISALMVNAIALAGPEIGNRTASQTNTQTNESNWSTGKQVAFIGGLLVICAGATYFSLPKLAKMNACHNAVASSREILYNNISANVDMTTPLSTGDTLGAIYGSRKDLVIWDIRNYILDERIGSIFKRPKLNELLQKNLKELPSVFDDVIKKCDKSAISKYRLALAESKANDSLLGLMMDVVAITSCGIALERAWALAKNLSSQ